MRGELAELIALVAHGNAFLYGLLPPMELTKSSSTFQYVESVRFVRRPRRWIARSRLLARIETAPRRLHTRMGLRRHGLLERRLFRERESSEGVRADQQSPVAG